MWKGANPNAVRRHHEGRSLDQHNEHLSVKPRIQNLMSVARRDALIRAAVGCEDDLIANQVEGGTPAQKGWKPQSLVKSTTALLQRGLLAI